MGKRTNSEGPSTKKRARIANNGQTRLDTFLTPKKIQDKGHGATTSLLPKVREYIEVDALEDGLEGPGESVVITPAESSKTAPSSPTKPKKTFDLQTTKPTEATYLPLDVNPVLYSPGDQTWSSEEVPYSFLAHAFATISQTKSRISILNTLVNALRTIISRQPLSLLPSLYLLSNSLSPPYVGIELGIGSSVLSKAIQHVSGLSAAALRKLYNTTGDIGDVAFNAKSKVRTLFPHAPLTIKGVYDALLKIAKCKGQGASQQKEKIIEKNLRVGAVRASILTALARAFALSPSPKNEPPCPSLHVSKALLDEVSRTLGEKKATNAPCQEALKAIFIKGETLVKEVYAQHPCYDDIVSALLQHGLLRLAEHVPLTVGIPLHPALGSPTRSLDEIYDRLGEVAFSAEFKYDGQRAQIHCMTDQQDKVHIKIFSRHLEDMTSKYPDVVALMESMMRTLPAAKTFILDSEIVAVDPSSGELKSFQELSNRSRKDVKLSDIKVSVCVFAFDLLYCNSKPLLLKSFRERREELQETFRPYTPDDPTFARFRFVESCESNAGKTVIEEFWRKAVSSRCEGLMIKVLDSMHEDDKSSIRSSRKPLPATYEPDKRTSSWLKLKKDYVDDIGDSIDMIPIGAWYGNGRKVGWWSPILLGLWEPSTGKVVAMCKCMSGFTDAFYKNLSETYGLDSDNCSNQPIWECELGGYSPDVYFKPREVWEIRGADITESPVSVAARGITPGNRGLSLRFPRFIKLRPDKSLEQASSPSVLASIWRQQAGKPTPTSADDGDLVDLASEDELEYEPDERSERDSD